MAARLQRVNATLLTSALVLPLTAPSASAADRMPVEPPLEAALPIAAAGECYGKVLVPASYREEPVEVTVREATDRFVVSPARFERASQTVTLRDAWTDIVAHQPQIAFETIELLHRPAGRRWVRGSPTGEQPPSEQEMQALLSNGIDRDAVQSGQCALEYYKPDVYHDAPLQILVHEASETLEVVDATFVSELLPVTLAPAHGRLVEIPAIWRDDEMDVVVESARTTWKPGTGPIQRIDNLTGEIVCRVDIPAVTETIPYRRLETPAMVTRIENPASEELLVVERLISDASTHRQAVPAHVDTIDVAELVEPGSYRWSLDDVEPQDGFEPTGRRVCLRKSEPVTLSYERGVVRRPGRFERTPRPARSQQIAVQRLVVDASFETLPVEAVTRTFTRRTLANEARVEWQPVLCETNVTPEVIRRLQSALEARGFSPNGIDGLLGPGTLGAVERLQQAASLSSGGLTLETFEYLGLPLHTSRPEDEAAVSASTEEP